MKIDIKKLLISIGIAEGVGLLSSLFSGLIGGNNNFFDSLTKPPLAPPPWIFGVVWPILYMTQ